LPGRKSIDSLPASSLPKAILDADPNLRYAPTVRLEWDNFYIFIGDRSLAVGCTMPYPGWERFKPTILRIATLLKDAGVIQSIQRFSMKYVDLIPSDDIGKQVAMVDASVVIGRHTLKEEVFSLRVEIPRDGHLNVVHVASSAVVTLADGSTKDGVIVEIDTISQVGDESLSLWLEHLPQRLETMHTANKVMFFECLRPETTVTLEPVYE